MLDVLNRDISLLVYREIHKDRTSRLNCEYQRLYSFDDTHHIVEDKYNQQANGYCPSAFNYRESYINDDNTRFMRPSFIYNVKRIGVDTIHQKRLIFKLPKRYFYSSGCSHQYKYKYTRNNVY